MSTAARIQYTDQPFYGRRRNRNMLNYKSQKLLHPWTEIEAFLVFIDETVLLTILRYTNQKENDLSGTARETYN